MFRDQHCPSNKHDRGALLLCSVPTISNPAPLLGISLHQAMDLESGCYSTLSPSLQCNFCLQKTVREGQCYCMHSNNKHLQVSKVTQYTLESEKEDAHTDLFPASFYHGVTIPKRSSSPRKDNPREENILFQLAWSNSFGMPVILKEIILFLQDKSKLLKLAIPFARRRHLGYRTYGP